MNTDNSTKPSFAAALRFWFILGWISFGGTTGHITIMHDFLVEKKKWISNGKFFHALNACMLLPGPEAHQLAIYIGWKLHGLKGGVISGVLFVLPSMFILLGLSITYATYGNAPILVAAFSGLKPAVLAIILFATWKVGQKALISIPHYIVALAAFGLSYFAHIAMPWIILGVVILALLIGLTAPSLLRIQQKKEQAEEREGAYYVNLLQERDRVQPGKLLRQSAVFVLLWSIPFLALLGLFAGPGFWRQLSFLFTRSAFFTIGGSYTVIPYVAGLVTGKLAWLSKTQMIDGFALAETTPGPLVIVLSYVGFMAGFNHFGGSILMGTVGLLAASYFTFLPNFILIFLGAPLIEISQKSAITQTMLSLVTAAVVGVIVNLAFYLGSDILFSERRASLDHINLPSLGWALFSLLLLVKFRIKTLPLVLLSLVFGLLRYSLSL